MVRKGWSPDFIGGFLRPSPEQAPEMCSTICSGEKSTDPALDKRRSCPIESTARPLPTQEASKHNEKLCPTLDTPKTTLMGFRQKPFTGTVLLLLSAITLAIWLLSSGSPTICWVDAPPQIIKDTSPLSVFQIREPVPTPLSATDASCRNCDNVSRTSPDLSKSDSDGCCMQLLMNHSFAFSYGHPFVGFYEPPLCDFDTITFNFTVTSRGRQFDRLGALFLGDVEIFRTSTAEPTENGISWTYLKDVSHYLALFQTSQKIIFDLGNLIDDTYTAPFNATLTATFFKGPGRGADEERAGIILPISSKKSSINSSSAFSLPSDNATITIPFPTNIRRAVVSISACGQGDEEFWFGNVYQSDRQTFPKISPMLGYSPFREVQLLIDGKLAGVVWPFPIIFTGGVVPGLWRPLVGIDAFDLRENEIDITPWLPLLCDGDSGGHTFEIRVVGINDDGKGSGELSTTVGNYWVVTGKIFLWENSPDARTIGALFFAETDEPNLSLSSVFRQNSTGDNTTLSYLTNVQRQISIQSVIFTPGRKFKLHRWTQTLDYSSNVKFTNTGGVQLIDQSTKGVDTSTGGYTRAYSYPIWVNTSFAVNDENGDFSIDAPIRRGLRLETLGPAVLPTGKEAFEDLGQIDGVVLHTTQNGSAHYLGIPSQRKAFGHGTTQQDFEFQGHFDPEGPDVAQTRLASKRVWRQLYSRTVVATNGTVTRDQERISGRVSRNIINSLGRVAQSLETLWIEEGPRRILGRGPQL